jgi:transposase-like protein
MPERRRRFSPQFKAEAVLLVIETGRPIAEVARDLGVHEGALGNWVKAWRDANPESEPELDCGGDGKAADAVTGSAAGCSARAAAAVLAGDRRWPYE